MTYELFNQGPAVYIPVILISLIITIVAYGAFPLIFSRARKKVVTRKKYNILCYCVNFLVMMVFIAINGEPSSGGPYLLWTWVFSSSGIKTLKKRRVLDGFQTVDCNEAMTYDTSEIDDTGAVVETDTITEAQDPKFEETTPDEALNTILEFQAKETVKAMEANRLAQPENEDDADFGLVPEKPIFTLALMSVDGEEEYLDKLYAASGEKIKYIRRGSTSVSGINGMIDIYDTYLPSGEPYKTIYINMYGAKKSIKAPVGFILNAATVQHHSVKEKEKPVKVKYCSRCGALIDCTTKVCTGCGKKYFRGLRFNKFSITVIALLSVIAAVSTLCVLQYSNIEELNEQISHLEEENSRLRSNIVVLQDDLDELNREYISLLLNSMR